MLPSEVTPVADAHRHDLNNMRQQIEAVLSGQEGILTQGNLTIWISKLKSAERAFDRFEACLLDEYRQKETLHQQRIECRLNHT